MSAPKIKTMGPDCLCTPIDSGHPCCEGFEFPLHLYASVTVLEAFDGFGPIDASHCEFSDVELTHSIHPSGLFQYSSSHQQGWGATGCTSLSPGLTHCGTMTPPVTEVNTPFVSVLGCYNDYDRGDEMFSFMSRLSLNCSPVLISFEAVVAGSGLHLDYSRMVNSCGFLHCCIQPTSFLALPESAWTVRFHIEVNE